MSDTHPRIVEPTWPVGPRRVMVGRREYGLPKGAGVARGPEGLYYFLIGARVHCATEKGEITIPNSLRHVIASYYFGINRPKTP